MKSKHEVESMIKEIETANHHVLKGELSNIQVNAPRALMQLSAEAQLQVLYWVIGKKFKSKLKKSV